MRLVLSLIAYLGGFAALLGAAVPFLPIPTEGTVYTVVNLIETSPRLVLLAALALGCGVAARWGTGWLTSLAVWLPCLALLASLAPTATTLWTGFNAGIPISVPAAVIAAHHAPPPEPETYQFADLGDRTLRIQVYRPAPDAPTPTVSVLLVHGGAWQSGDVGDLPEWTAWLVAQGFVVFDAEYRLAPPPNWRTAPGDVKCAIGWVAANAARFGTDVNRLVVLGRSAGAHLALLAAYTPATSVFQSTCGLNATPRAVVAFYPFVNLTETFDNPINERVFPTPNILRALTGGEPTTTPAPYRLASPSAYVTAGAPPTLLVHGALDQFAPIGPVRTFATQLTFARARVQFVELPMAEHAFDVVFDGLHSQLARGAVLKFLADLRLITPGGGRG